MPLLMRTELILRYSPPPPYFAAPILRLAKNSEIGIAAVKGVTFTLKNIFLRDYNGQWLRGESRSTEGQLRGVGESINPFQDIL